MSNNMDNIDNAKILDIIHQIAALSQKEGVVLRKLLTESNDEEAKKIVLSMIN